MVILGLRQSLRTRLPTAAPRHPLIPTHPLLTHTDLALNTSQETQNAPQPIKLLSLHPTQTENNKLLMVSYVLLTSKMNFTNNRLTSLQICKLRAYLKKLIGRLGVLVDQVCMMVRVVG